MGQDSIDFDPALFCRQTYFADVKITKKDKRKMTIHEFGKGLSAGKADGLECASLTDAVLGRTAYEIRKLKNKGIEGWKMK